MKNKLSTNKLSKRVWFNIIMFGLIGQIAWNVENMYFNTFLYNSVYKGMSQTAIDGSMSVTTAISKMVAYSAITAVLTTFIMGNLSDNMRKRKIFISAGYIAWGITTAAFGFISCDNIALLFNLTDEIKILTATVITVIVMDCVMTFMGSTANDSAFNAYVTESCDSSNRATVESVLALMPFGAMGVVLGLGALVETIGYSKFFLILGFSVVVCGIIGLFTLNETVHGEKEPAKDYFKNLIYGFRPSVIKENSILYTNLAAICIYSIAIQVFFPYLLIYLEHQLGLSLDALASLKPWHLIVAAVALVVVVVGLITIGKLIDKFGKKIFMIVSLACFIIGLFVAGKDTSMGTFVLGIAPLFLGYGLLGIIFNASIRDNTPVDKVGLFQGVRMIFFVLIPMFVGPKIGDFSIRASNTTYINEFGVKQIVPTSSMFTAAGVVALFTIIPVAILLIKGVDKKEKV